MKLVVGTVLLFLGFAQFSWGQTNGSANLVSGDSSAPAQSAFSSRWSPTMGREKCSTLAPLFRIVKIENRD
jgi:hypothetical protein